MPIDKLILFHFESAMSFTKPFVFRQYSMLLLQQIHRIPHRTTLLLLFTIEYWVFYHCLSSVTIVSLQGTKVFLSKQIERFLEFFLLFFVDLCTRFYISFAVKTSGFHFDLFLDVFGCHLNADHFPSFSHTQPHVHIVCECSSLYLCDSTLCLTSFGIRLSILRIICDFLFKNRSGNKWGGVVDRCQCGKLKVWKIGKIFELWPSFVNNMVVPHLVRLYAFVCSLCSLSVLVAVIFEIYLNST